MNKLIIKKASHAKRRGWFVYDESGLPVNYLPFKGLDFILKYFIPENFPKARIIIEK